MTLSAKTSHPKLWLWIVLFLLWNLVLWQPGNPNPGSRLATMAAMADQRTFAIDSFVLAAYPWTNDWAEAPNGHYYSNKAPGPMLLGYPVFRAIDMVLGVRSDEIKTLPGGGRRSRLPIYNHVLSLLVQTVPFAIVMGIWLRRRMRDTNSSEAISFGLLAALFGNTAALFMNTYFGHGMAATCLVAAVLCLEEDQAFGVGLFIGLAALCDYALVVTLPVGLLTLLFVRRTHFRDSTRYVFGLLPALILWSWYHTSCFGTPWTLALRYQNPQFVDVPAGSGTLWGIFHFVPRFDIVGQLLAGPSRGLLFTQPWIFLLPFCSLKDPQEVRPYSIRGLGFFTAVTGLLLLLLNAGFGGWHGGMTIGPRYLSPVLPLFALWTTMLYPIWNQRVRQLAWALLGISVFLTALIFATVPFVPPGVALWPALVKFLAEIAPAKGMSRLLFCVASATSVWWLGRKTAPK